MTQSDPDVVVIGSGPNGLVAACRLAMAGLRVLVLEANPQRFGGAVGSEEATLPGFIHDVGAAFFPFGRTSPAFRALELGARGVTWRLADVDSCHPAPDGSLAVLSRDLDVSARNFGSAEDGAKWRALAAWHARVEERFLAALFSPFPSIDAILSLSAGETLRLADVFARSGRSLATHLFRSEAARRVLPSLALHVDVGPDDAFGAALGYVLGVTATTGGFAVPEGGAQRITGALLGILRAHGGEARLAARLERIIVRDERARAVLLSGGETIDVQQAVMADTSAPSLFLDLVERHHLPAFVVRFMQRFPFGWGTFKVDWAIDGAVPWTAELARHSAVVHAGDSLDDLARFTSEVRAGNLPRNPYLVVGQQSLADPTRAPAGKHTLWAYTRVPSSLPAGWAANKESFADRIDERIERLAPGFKALIKARRTVSPDELHAMDANLVGGDIGGGSNAWHRQLLFRPLFPYFNYRTPVRRLYLCSSYAHPGAGVHGMCGFNAAQAALEDIR